MEDGVTYSITPAMGKPGDSDLDIQEAVKYANAYVNNRQ